MRLAGKWPTSQNSEQLLKPDHIQEGFNYKHPQNKLEKKTIRIKLPVLSVHKSKL